MRIIDQGDTISLQFEDYTIAVSLKVHPSELRSKSCKQELLVRGELIQNVEWLLTATNSHTKELIVLGKFQTDKVPMRIFKDMHKAYEEGKLLFKIPTY